MTIRTLEDIDVAGKRTLVRVDFNVPLRDGEITDNTRILAALPTIRHLLEAGARVILMSHLGRPNGQVRPEYSLEPVAARLAELLNGEVMFTDDCIGDGVRKVAGDMRDGDLALLENLRFHPGESANDAVFAQRLAAQTEVYVNDAFGTLHRAHASTVGVPALIADKAAGHLVRREVEALGGLLRKPERPFVAILGGAKVSDKIAVFDNLMPRVDAFLVGGAMAYTFLAARGAPVGDSRVEREKFWQARRIMERAAERDVALHLPIDHVVSTEIDGSAESQIREAIPDGTKGVDIGPATVDRFAEVLAGARTVFWNGPMGIFEVPPFDAGTRGVAEAVAAADAFSAVGGGDSAAALKQLGLAGAVSHVSTGGGASLQYLSGGELPGLVALEG